MGLCSLGSKDETLYTVFAHDEKTFENIPSERYAIVPRSMRSMADILELGQNGSTSHWTVAGRSLSAKLA